MGDLNSLERAQPGDIDLDCDALECLGEAFESEIAAKRLPGAVVMIARDGAVGYFEAFGERDPASRAPMEKDAIFRIYSMTKPIVSLAVLQLVEEGEILISDPISAYIPAFAEAKVGVRHGESLALEPLARAITLHDLLRHTSGLTYEFLGVDPVHKAYLGAKISSTLQTNAEHADALAALPLLNQPGVAWDYGRSTDVLGRLLEVVEGKPLSEILHERIFAPLHMRDTGFSVPETHHGRIAEPFALDPDTQAPVRLLNVSRPAKFESGGGGLVSTAQDYAQFCAMLAGQGALGGERLIGRKTLEWMTADHLGREVAIGSDLLPAGDGFGLGFAVRLQEGLSPTPGSKGLYYWGGIAGTSFWVDPAEDLFALMLIQAPGRRDYYRQMFRNLVYSAIL